jgi:hypothetical protein
MTFKIIAILSSLAFLTIPTWVLAANDLTTPNHFSEILEL